MSRFNSPKPNAAGRRCTVCGSSYHDRREHTAEERLASRDVREAPALERKYLPKGMAPNELRTKRRQAGLSQLDLAALVGVDPLTVSRWERSEAMTPTSTLQLACPTCAGDIEVEYEALYNGQTDVISLRTYCFCPLSRDEAYDLLMDESARQAELATERAGER